VSALTEILKLSVLSLHRDDTVGVRTRPGTFVCLNCLTLISSSA
jgi:hypothetical protein